MVTGAGRLARCFRCKCNAVPPPAALAGRVCSGGGGPARLVGVLVSYPGAERGIPPAPAAPELEMGFLQQPVSQADGPGELEVPEEHPCADLRRRCPLPRRN